MSPESAMLHHHVSTTGQNGQKQAPAIVSEPHFQEGEPSRIQLFVVCNQTARCNKILHTGPFKYLYKFFIFAAC